MAPEPNKWIIGLRNVCRMIQTRHKESSTAPRFNEDCLHLLGLDTNCKVVNNRIVHFEGVLRQLELPLTDKYTVSEMIWFSKIYSEFSAGFGSLKYIQNLVQGLVL